MSSRTLAPWLAPEEEEEEEAAEAEAAVVEEEEEVVVVVGVLEEEVVVVLQRQVEVSEVPSPEKHSSRNLPSVEETRACPQE